MRYLFLIMLLGCANEDNPNPPTQIPQPETHRISNPKPPTVLQCEVSSTEKVEDCILYHLICENGSTDMVLLCEIQPIGVITNPPRPINAL